MKNRRASVITCTYHPDPNILHRVVTSVLNQNKSSISFEYIIVDNSPDRNLIPRCPFLTEYGEIQVIHQPVPGLTNARIRGVKIAKNDIIIFVDDDNELDNEYVINALKTFNDNKEVIACGPGNIVVDMPAGKNMEPFKGYFQETKLDQSIFGKAEEWTSFCPPGTGLCMRKSLMDAYILKIESGEFSSMDRTGKSLNSGGDAQIVLLGMKMGFQVGKVPELKLVHIVEERKANPTYIRDMLFGVYATVPFAAAEVFPSFKNQHLNKRKMIYRNYFSLFRPFFLSVLRLNKKIFDINNGAVFGKIYGTYAAMDKPIPTIHKIIKRLIY